MEKLTKRECYLFSDPGRIYDLIGWDAATKQYRLQNDDGRIVDVSQNEFVPVSLAGEDLVLASDTGEMVPASEAMERGLAIALPEPSVGPSSHSPATTANKPRRPSKTKDKSAEAQGAAVEARSRVRELLAGKSRDEMAEAAAGILGVSTEDLITKYAHLDNGRFRMVLGNRIAGVFQLSIS